MADDKKATIGIDTYVNDKGLVQTKKQVKGITEQIEKAQEAMDNASSSSSSFGLKAAAVFTGLIVLGKKTFNAISNLVSAYAENARAVNMLEASFKAVGYTSAQAMKQAKAFASEMQGLTGIADEAFLNAQRLLANYGVVGAKAQESIRAAYALSVGVGMDFESSLLQIAKAAAGSTSSLSRYGIVLGDGVKSGEKFDAVLAQINSRFGAAAQAAMDDTITKTKALAEEWGDFKELLGKELEPLFRKLIDYSREFVQGLSTLFNQDQDQKRYAENLSKIAVLQERINKGYYKGYTYKRLEELNALKQENFELERKFEKQIRETSEQAKQAEIQEKKVEKQRQSVALAQEETKAAEDNLKAQQKILDNMGLSSSKDLRGWGKASETSEPAPTDLEVAAGGGNALANAADSVARYANEQAALEELYNEKKAYIEQEITDEQLKNEALTNLQTQYQQQQLILDKNQSKARQQVYASMWGALTNLANSSNRKVAAIGKVASVAQATMSMFTGAAKALELPFPANLAAVATVLAQGAMLVEQIQSVKLAKGGLVKAVTGGVNTVIGEGGSDEAVLPLDNTQAMQRIGSAIGEAGGVGGGNVVVNINVQATGGVQAILEQLTEASRNGVVEALEFANLNYKVGAEQQGLSV